MEWKYNSETNCTLIVRNGVRLVTSIIRHRGNMESVEVVDVQEGEHGYMVFGFQAILHTEADAKAWVQDKVLPKLAMSEWKESELPTVSWIDSDGETLGMYEHSSGNSYFYLNRLGGYNAPSEVYEIAANAQDGFNCSAIVASRVEATTWAQRFVQRFYPDVTQGI